MHPGGSQLTWDIGDVPCGKGITPFQTWFLINKWVIFLFNCWFGWNFLGKYSENSENRPKMQGSNFGSKVGKWMGQLSIWLESLSHYLSNEKYGNISISRYERFSIGLLLPVKTQSHSRSVHYNVHYLVKHS